GIGDYHPSYVMRRDRFGSLAAAAGFPRSVAIAIDQAFAGKLGDSPPILTGADASAAVAVAALRALERSMDSAGPAQTFAGSLGLGVRMRMGAGSREWIDRARSYGLWPTPCAIEDPARGVAIVYDACLCALRSWADGTDNGAERVETAL